MSIRSKKQPGIMIYFADMAPLRQLAPEDKSRLLDAMLDYAEYGVVPDFSGTLAVVWGFLQPRLDNDSKRYRKRVVKNTHNSYCARAKQTGQTPLSFDAWLEREGIDEEGYPLIPEDADRCPTSRSNTITSSISDPSSISSVAGTTEDDYEALRSAQIAKLDHWH